MPEKMKDVKQFFIRIAILETKVDNLMTINKWQMGIVAAILVLAIKTWVTR